MDENYKLDEKLYQYLIHLFDSTDTKIIHEFLIHSELFISDDWTYGIKRGLYVLTIKVDPEIYKVNQKYIKQFSDTVASKLMSFTGLSITKIETTPDLDKFQILNNRITPIVTPWEDINKEQNNLINQLRTAVKTQDFQNIGNSSRTTLQKLANIVFDPLRHIPPNETINVSNGKYKNQLHTFIKSELNEGKFKELREYAESVVTTAEKSVDLANKLTHDLNAEKLMAESCVLSVISVIGIVKMIVK